MEYNLFIDLFIYLFIPKLFFTMFKKNGLENFEIFLEFMGIRR